MTRIWNGMDLAMLLADVHKVGPHGRSRLGESTTKFILEVRTMGLG